MSLRRSLDITYKLPTVYFSNFYDKRTKQKCTAMLQDFVQKYLASSIDEKYKLPKDVLDERGIYVARVDKHSPFRFQILKDVLVDGSKTNKDMLDCQPTNVHRIGSDSELSPLAQVMVTGWLRLLKAEEGRKACPVNSC